MTPDDLIREATPILRWLVRHYTRRVRHAWDVIRSAAWYGLALALARWRPGDAPWSRYAGHRITLAIRQDLRALLRVRGRRVYRGRRVPLHANLQGPAPAAAAAPIPDALLQGVGPKAARYLRLRFEADMPWRAIAGACGVTESTARLNVRYALGRLRQRLEAVP